MDPSSAKPAATDPSQRDLAPREALSWWTIIFAVSPDAINTGRSQTLFD